MVSLCPGIWWFPRKESGIRFLDTETLYEKLYKNFHLKVSTICFFQGISVFSNLKGLRKRKVNQISRKDDLVKSTFWKLQKGTLL